MVWAAAGIVVAIAATAIPYLRLAKRVDQQLAGNLLNNVDYYSSPEVIAPGDPMSPSDLAAVGHQPVQITLTNDRVASIVDDDDRASASPNYQLQPQLLTNMSDVRPRETHARDLFRHSAGPGPRHSLC